MKNILLIAWLLTTFHAFAQVKYPVPPENSMRLFYIQHTDNTNTVVYDWNPKNTEQPIEVYRLLYAEDGAKKELTVFQRTMAYGINIVEKTSSGYTFTLAATKNLQLKLETQVAKPYVHTLINGQHIKLKRLFIELKKAEKELFPKPNAVVFEGTEMHTGKPVKLRVAAANL